MPRAAIFGRYILLHLRIFCSAVSKRKISFHKIYNALACGAAFFLRREASGRSPMMLSLELGNDCNANCLFCRDAQGRISDVNPEGSGFIPKGRMPVEMAEAVLAQLAPHALMAVLYTNGEPLLYRDLPRLIRFATERRLATMIATNGTLLTERTCRAILEAGIDCVKVAVSGWKTQTHNIQVRQGDVEEIRAGIRRLVEMNRQGRHGTVVMVDYILYTYNRDELPLVRQFCHELDVMLSVRPGNPQGGLEGREPPLVREALPLKHSCDWLWKAVQVDWNGDILHCCECAVWSKTQTYGRFIVGETDLLQIWNGGKARSMRRAMIRDGRKAAMVCRACVRRGISFKW